VGGTELACSQVVAMGRMLREMLATVSPDVLHLVRFSPKERQKNFTGFLWPSPGSLMSPSLYLFHNA
jgi:hypothetical protein